MPARNEVFLIMKELLFAITAGLVEDPSAIEITQDEPDAEGVVVFHLHVAESDMGRVIGRQGRIAKALRTVMRSGAIRHGMPSVAVLIN